MRASLPQGEAFSMNRHPVTTRYNLRLAVVVTILVTVRRSSE
jgi:hypothetical protein